MIYLASPYAHDDWVVREERYEGVCVVAGQLIRSGEVVFSPIAYSRSIFVVYERFCDYLLEDWEGWPTFDKQILLLCEKVLVLCLDGWRESVGIAAEIEWAKEAGIPVEYIEL